jgi:gliding motility-associated-like protein
MRYPLLVLCSWLYISLLHAQGTSNCTLRASFVSATPITCPGQSLSTVIVSATGARGPVRFLADGVAPGRTSGIFNNFFDQGNHFVIVRDSLGCADTVTFTVTVTSSALTVRTDKTDALCNGDNTGSATAFASGGMGNYNIVWQDCSGGPLLRGASISGLFAGCYRVTVTDDNRCSVTDTVRINEPPPFRVTFITDSVQCFGNQNGKASITVMGGQEPYNVLWSSGEIGLTATRLRAGRSPVTIGDSRNCVSTILVDVGGPPAYVIDSISNKGITCATKVDGRATVNVRGGNSGYTYSWSNQATTRTINNLNLGTFSVTVTDRKGCTLTGQTDIRTQRGKDIIFQRRNERCPGECNGELTALVSGGIKPYKYFWQEPRLSRRTTFVDSLCPGFYQLIVEDSIGCRDTSRRVEILKADSIKILFNITPPRCSGDRNGQVEARVAGGFRPFQYRWSNGQTTQTAINVGCGTFTVTVRDAEGCTKVDSVKITCPPPLRIERTISRNTNCVGNATGQITVRASGGQAPLSYRWSDPTNQIDSTAVNLPTGRYTVTVRDANGCTLTAIDSIRNPVQLRLQVFPQNVICNGENSGGVKTMVGGGNTPYTYLWNNQTTRPNLDSVPVGNYAVTVTDANGCTANAFGIQIGQPANKVQISLASEVKPCVGESNGTIRVGGSGSNGGPFRYRWSTSSTNNSITGLEAGAYTVTVADNRGCTATLTTNLASLDSVLLNVITEQPGCNGGSNGRAVVNSIRGGAGQGNSTNYTFKWSVPNSLDSVFINGLRGGRPYTVTATDSQGCKGVFTFFLGQPPPVSVEAMVKDVTCFGGSNGEIEIKGISVHPIVAYQWSNGATRTPITDLRSGIYDATVTDDKGCTGTKSIEVKQPPAIITTYDVKSLICNNDSNGIIRATVAGGTPGYRFLWSTGSTRLRLDSLKAGFYRLTITDRNNCVRVDTVPVRQPNAMQLMPTIIQPTCNGFADGQLKLSINNGKPPFQYSIMQNPYSPSPNFVGLKAGPYFLKVKDSDNCLALDTINITQPPPVSVDLGPDLTVSLGDPVTLTATPQNTTGLINYTWRSAIIDTIKCISPTDCESVLLNPKQTNTYIVSLIDAKGCRTQSDIRIILEKSRGLFVPTAFTPNADSNNDRLWVHGRTKQIREIQLFRVYDRWGELVYEDRNFKANDTSRGWDGRWRNQDCQSGVYVWYAEVEYVDGYQEAHKGQVTLLR